MLDTDMAWPPSSARKCPAAIASQQGADVWSLSRSWPADLFSFTLTFGRSTHMVAQTAWLAARAYFDSGAAVAVLLVVETPFRGP